MPGEVLAESMWGSLKWPDWMPLPFNETHLWLQYFAMALILIFVIIITIYIIVCNARVSNIETLI